MQYVRLRQREHTAKGLKGALNPAAVLDALLRRTDDPSVDIYDVPLLSNSQDLPNLNLPGMCARECLCICLPRW